MRTMVTLQIKEGQGDKKEGRCERGWEEHTSHQVTCRYVQCLNKCLMQGLESSQDTCYKYNWQVRLFHYI